MAIVMVIGTSESQHETQITHGRDKMPADEPPSPLDGSWSNSLGHTVRAGRFLWNRRRPLPVLIVQTRRPLDGAVVPLG